LLGTSAEILIKTYEEEDDHQIKWEDSPSEVASHDWTEYLGSPSYQRAFVDFFEDRLVEFGYGWKAMVFYYLCEGEKPLINRLVNGGE
jgi:questin oxidase-like protein